MFTIYTVLPYLFSDNTTVIVIIISLFAMLTNLILHAPKQYWFTINVYSIHLYRLLYKFVCFVQLQGILIGFVFVTQILPKLNLPNNKIKATTTYKVIMTYFHETAYICVLFWNIASFTYSALKKHSRDLINDTLTWFFFSVKKWEMHR